MNLGENIYKFRTMKNMSQGDLADALEVSRQSVSKWENNSAVPELEKLIKMAQLFDITLDELVSQAEANTDTPLKPENTPPAPDRFPALKIAGAILLTCGLLAVIILFGFSIFLNDSRSGFDLGLMLGLPLITAGLGCLCPERNIGYWCSIGIYLLFSLLKMISGRQTDADTITTCYMLVAGFLMLIWTFTLLRKKSLSTSVAILSALLILSMVGMLVISLLPPPTYEAYPGLTKTTNIPASKEVKP